MAKITDPGTGDQIDNARGHAAAMDAAVHQVATHQTRRMAGSESTKGDQLLVGGKLAGLARVK